MNIFYLLYRVLTLILFSLMLCPFLIFILFTGKYRKHLKERFGFIPDDRIKKKGIGPGVWIHAVSLGEIKVANSIIDSLTGQIPGCSVVLSTTTEHGRNLAMNMLGDKVSIIYSPVDLFFTIKKSLRLVNPDILIFLETEIWPSWIIEAQKMGIKVVLLNGRISKRSFGRYLYLRFFLKNILSRFYALSMISAEDKERIICLGADSEKTVVNGNAKYDLLISQTVSGMKENIQEIFSLDPDTPVIVAGSTRTGEEAILLKAFRKIIQNFPDTVLIIAPRHLERIKDIVQLLQHEKLGYHLRSELRTPGVKRKENILIIDCYGELFDIYSAATIAFCGASLVPLGGQNPLEPAAWGVPVFHGPHMDDFLDARNLLAKYDASVEVAGPDDFAEKATYYLNNPDLLKQKGVSEKNALQENEDASKRHAGIIINLINHQ